MLEQHGYVKVEITQDQIEKLEAHFQKAKAFIEGFLVNDYMVDIEKRFLVFRYKDKAFNWSKARKESDKRFIRFARASFDEDIYKPVYTNDMNYIIDILNLSDSGNELLLTPPMNRVLTKYTA